jgi:hypothetical protein
MSLTQSRRCSSKILPEAPTESVGVPIRVITDLQFGLPILPKETQMIELALGDRLDAFLATLTEASDQPNRPA